MQLIHIHFIKNVGKYNSRAITWLYTLLKFCTKSEKTNTKSYTLVHYHVVCPARLHSVHFKLKLKRTLKNMTYKFLLIPLFYVNNVVELLLLNFFSIIYLRKHKAEHLFFFNSFIKRRIIVLIGVEKHLSPEIYLKNSRCTYLLRENKDRQNMKEEDCWRHSYKRERHKWKRVKLKKKGMTTLKSGSFLV